MAATSRDTGPEQHASSPATGRLMQIGEAAEWVGLSIRTALRDQLATAEGFADTLRDKADHHGSPTA